MAQNKKLELSHDAVELIKEFEGLKCISYHCPAGERTIGYGHVIKEDINCYITKEEAERLLKLDVMLIEDYLNSGIVKIEMTQGQFDALCSLIFNWGVRNFHKSKGLKALNKEKFKLAADEFFSKEKGVVNINGKFCKGLYNRRKTELKMFNN